MFALNEILILKKPHACGGEKWQIVRLGADVKIQCCTCNKYRNLMRSELEKIVKSRLSEKKEN